MGSIEDHLNSGTVDISAGNVKDLRKNAEGLVGVGSAANPVTIKLAAGTFTLDRLLTLPNYCTLKGAGRDATIIQRTSSLVNTAFGNASCDPVISTFQAQSVTLEDLSIIHSGTTDASITTTTQNPVALFTGASLRFKMHNVRLEGNYAGWYDKTDSADTSFLKPIPDNVIGDEDYQYHLDNCIVIGHSTGGGHQISRHELFATGCKFICDIRAGDVLQTGAMPKAFNHWEYLVGYFKSCTFILRCAQTLTVSSTTEVATAFAIVDTAISDTYAYCDNCLFHLDLSDGDVNSANSGAASVFVNGSLHSSGTVRYNVFEALASTFRYETGTITSAPSISGIYCAAGNAGTSVEIKLKDCKFVDFGGSGGTKRADVIIPSALGNSQPKLLQTENCFIQSWDYRILSGSPVLTHANFLTEPNTLNYQRGSATFSSQATAGVTLPLDYQASAGVTDYAVFLEPAANETFWVSGKTNTGFTLNSSNATSAATIRYVVRR